ncbi:MAG TPA: methyltransferase [Anaerolineales bacterium]|nr:methyltransferase [Anaerolineales bacterium]
MNGSEAVLNHVPELKHRPRRIIALLIALTSFALATAGMVIVDRLWPQWTALGQIAGVILGFVISAQFFWRRREYREKHGDLSYRNAFLHFMLPGLPVMFAAIAHNAYVPGEPVLNGWWAPITSMLALYLFVVGALLYVRAYVAFGVDNLSMLYVYFPSEGRLVDSSIYSVLRHPAYAGVVRIGLAFGLWRGTAFSIFFGLFMPVGLTIWLRLVEEPELIERFGSGYADYRKKVPAFWPRWQDAPKFWRFLIRGQ